MLSCDERNKKTLAFHTFTYLIHRALETPERILLFNETRDKEKLRLKYSAMRTDAFRFFRGTCHLFYEDLFHALSLPASPPTWICGDLHLENFGSFRGGDRMVYFDINDFDEAILAPALWELTRLLTSIEVAAQALKYTNKHIADLHNAVLNGYTSRLLQGKPMTIETATSEGLIRQLLEKVGERKEKKLLKERTDPETDYTSLRTDNIRAFAISSEDKKSITAAVSAWLTDKKTDAKWKAIDAVYRLAGTGSIGIKRNVVLVLNKTTGKKYLLDIKQALPSSLLPYVSIPQPKWENEAERIINIQNRMQHMCPGWLNEISINNNWYVVKEIQPISDKINFSGFERLFSDQLHMVFTLGELTASAQLRSSGRNNAAIADEMIAFAKQGDWKFAVVEYANNYCKQVLDDYRTFSDSFDKGYFK